MADGSVLIEAKLTDEEIEKGINSIKTDLKSLEKASSSVSKNMSSHFKNFGDKASKAGTALTVGLTAPLTALGVAGVKYNAQMEDFEANLTTLLGSADDAKDMLADLKEMANTTPFETSDLLEATQMMLGFGLEAKKTKGYLQMLGDISMGNSEKLMSLTRAFSQIGASGKATMEDINQMIDAGFNPLQIMTEKTGKSMADLRDEVSDGEVSFEDIADAMKTATSESGRYYKSMEKASKTMNGKMSSALDALNTALGDLTESLLPLATKAVEKITEWANAFTALDDKSKQTILTIAGIVVAVGPVITIIGKLSTGIGATIKVFESFKSGISTLKTALSSASNSTGTFSKAISAISSPVGLAVAAITVLIVAIGTKLYEAQKKAEEGMQAVGNGIADFMTGIDSAEGYLERFNNTLFSTTDEQKKLEEEMKSVQDGITKICKTASDERRNYTQEEITQLDEYFKKLRELKDREIEIQQSISNAIAQQAEQNAQSFEGSLEEYKINSQEWINTAQQQAEAEISLINERTTQEIALLQQRYGEKATLENRLSNLIDMKLDDYMNKNAYLSKEKEINDKIKEIDDKISNYQNRLKTNKDISKQLKIVEEILSAPKTINDFNEETFNNLVEKVIVGEVDENGKVYPNTINFILKVGSSYQYEINDDKTVSFRTTNMGQ